MKTLRSSALIAFVALCTACGFAQSTATLSGAVTDPTGAAVPNAQVKIHSLATGTERNVTTDTAGLYNAPSLIPGDYSIEATSAGFSSYKIGKVTLAVDQGVVINMKLAISSAGETIEVESAASQIEAQTITVGEVISKEVVQEIPLNGRHFLDLTVLTAGGVTAPATGSLTAPSRGLGSNSFVTAGNREDSVNFQINGVNLNDMVQNQITFQPSINTTSEFKIDNSTYSAEYGRSSGSIVNVSTRSGTNKFHGEVFDYLRNNSFDTRNFFNLKGTAQYALKRNNFGASVGGPIFRDKTFFFASYEGLRQHQGLPLNGTTVLTANDRANVTDPVSKALLAYIPVGVPNTATSNIVSATVNGPVQTDQGTIDLLHNFSQKDSLHAFYAIQKDIRTEPNLQGNTIAGFGDHRQAARQILTLNETHIFNSHFVNDLRLGFNRIGIQFIPNLTTDPGTLGFNNYPAGIKPGGGIPQITISGYGLNIGGPSGFPQGRNDTLGSVADTLNYTLGKNQLKFGGEFRRFLNVNFSNDTGSISFVATPALTINGTLQPARSALQNFQQGQAGSFTITPNAITSRLYENSFGGFFVDNYRLSKRLTLEAGLRFEWNGPSNVGSGHATVFDTATVSLYPVGTNGFNHLYKNNYNYEPRVGFIFDAYGDGKTILRGGFGLMADQPETNLVSGLTSNAPLTSKVAYTASTTATANPSPTIPLESLYSSAAAAAISVAAVDPNYRNAYTETYNLNLQQQFPLGVVFSLGYYGSEGKHLRQGININEILPTTGARTYLKLASTSPVLPGASINANITQARGNGISNYNGLWATLKKSSAHGLTGTLNYQFTKSMDEGSLAGGQFTDILQPRLNYGLSDFDTRHRISANAIYDLPFKGNRFVEGFKLSSIVQFQTGNPLNITTTSTYTGTANVQHPNLIARIPYAKNYIINGPNETVQWFNNPSTLTCNTAVAGCSFQLPSTGFGNMVRNGARGPGLTNVDASLEKSTKIRESLALNLRIDAFDLFNHPNFGNPGTSATLNSTSLGVITATRFPVADLGSSRQLQLSAKIVF